MEKKKSTKSRVTSRTQRKKLPASGDEPAGKTVYQFKITLRGIKPAIWRRIQVENCTLERLHEHIQMAMGWTNSHLHQFEIAGRYCGDPDLLEDLFEELDFLDSTQTLISQILPPTKKKFAFKYEYDFGDGWEHEILYEGSVLAEAANKYPVCLAGERACPPEDVGGIWGYQNFLAARADPKHEEHEEMMDWYGQEYSPEIFDAATATQRMNQSYPEWRIM
ncbi:Plasmid pRiA4b ORF-3-like protein [Anatilimnocola aggregata]|uniref:Plasmid pRiA4b ORF-3-like protein n=1 Tax=Anatilimnocola aggregata TaxID=2528021 RepID=A0A517Y825_9BACT|nr:plasmid pRiA4b ORF-3 family protein [Anatilimnocola aggregata]QDU26351.1 Plasmid pRiA4b ORF-3-like protein [Anatilimnocola aggregata]